jgi:hypothetical protein
MELATTGCVFGGASNGAREGESCGDEPTSPMADAMCAGRALALVWLARRRSIAIRTPIVRSI